MVALVATQAYVYDQRSLSPGDAFEASEKDAHLLTLIGRAKPAAVASRSLQTRDLAVEGDTPDTPSDRPKRIYRRRDLTPEQP